MTTAVLAVEDSPTQREQLRTHLAAAGFDVTVAGDGEEALDHLRTRRFDLVVSDVEMPRMDGYELCRRIKATDPQLPVVLLTSLSDPIEIVHGLEAGADNFLRKPYDAQQLLARLETILALRHHRAVGGDGAALEVLLADQRFEITAERQQMLDLLVTSFEELVEVNGQLQQREQALLQARDELAAQLRATELERQRLAALLWAVPQAIVITDADGRITDISDRLLAILGQDPAQVIGRRTVDCARLLTTSGEVVPDDDRPVARVLSGREASVEVGTSFDLLLETANGPVPVIVRAAPVLDHRGEVSAAVAVVEAIGARSHHDLLTRLPNHAIFVDRVARTAQESAKDRERFAILAVALDRFERLRGSLSPSAVDGVVSDLAARLRALLEEDPDWALASASYFADDMFGVILPSLDDETDGVRMAHELAGHLSLRHVVEGVTVDLTATVAVVIDDGSTTDPVQLVTAAVRAARQASTSGGGTVEVVDPSVGERASDLLRQEAELRDAIDAGQLELHYQPVVAVDDGRPVGVEALVRWRHPERGLLPPDAFVPLAEDSGLVVPLGLWVLSQACRDAARWRRELPGAADLFVSVNLAASQLNLPEIGDQVADVLARTGLDPTGLRLEVTETGVVADPDTAATRLHELTAQGVRVAIDDFGTGYASLLQLRRFPVQSLKIDRAFVAGMIDEPDDASIVKASVGLARALGLAVVAEGVETPRQRDALRALGCELAQGFLWSRPVPAPELDAWWRSQHQRVDGS